MAQKSWEITDDGILRISGQGMIPNEMHPWLKTPEDFETWEEYDKYREKINGITHIIFGEGITRIGDNVTDELYNITDISFPSTLKEIGSSNFFSMANLQSVVFPDQLEIINHSFDYCKSLQSVSFPESIKSISGFENCDALQNVTFPTQVELIGGFSDCDSLKEIFIPASVKTIVIPCFTGNTSLERVEVDIQNNAYMSEDGVLYYKYDYEPNNRSLMAYPAGRTNTSFTVPADVSEIENYAFSGCKSLKKVIIPFGVEWIGYDAFRGCPIENMIIPDSVTKIMSRTFDQSTIITCTKGSAADKYAQENGNSILYRRSPCTARRRNSPSSDRHPGPGA